MDIKLATSASTLAPLARLWQLSTLLLLAVACADPSALEEGEETRADEKWGNAAAGTFALGSSVDCDNPCSFFVHSTFELKSVRYEADGWELGEGYEEINGFAISYTFNSLGFRKIRAIGLDASGSVVAESTTTVNVRSGDQGGWGDDSGRADNGGDNGGGNRGGSGVLPDVPYFFQYNNNLHPSASCQNTSIAMVLGYLGWGGRPDDITRSYGKDMAQDPGGLARLFNIYASNSGFAQRLNPTRSGTLEGLRSELDRGNPVIIHGYFTSYGHVLVVLGYDEGGYYVHDPAGRWSERFKGGYGGRGSGHKAYYSRAAFEAAVSTSDGYSYFPLWYHVLR